MNNIWVFRREKKGGEWTVNRKMTRQKEQEEQAENREKREPNDSPEIPDRGETSDITALPSGVLTSKEVMMDAGSKQTTIHSNQECLLQRSRSTMVQFGGPLKQGKPTHLQHNGTGHNLNAAFFNNSVTKREFVYSKMQNASSNTWNSAKRPTAPGVWYSKHTSNHTCKDLLNVSVLLWKMGVGLI